jgi:DNA-binding NarL/FixJ family response regulator
VTRILIADDHEVVRTGLRAVLETHEGWEVVAEAENGKDAVTKALGSQPDVAIIDYSLPLINGVEATRQIRARLPNIQILIFTMFDNELLVRDCWKRARARMWSNRRLTSILLPRWNLSSITSRFL